MHMEVYITFDNNEIEKDAITCGGIFYSAEAISSLIKRAEAQHRMKAKQIEFSVETGMISDEAAKFLRKNYPLSLKKLNGSACLVTFSCEPEKAVSAFITTMSAVDVGEKTEKLLQWEAARAKTGTEAKARAQQHIKAGLVDRGCPVVMFITELNSPVVDGNSIQKTVNFLINFPEKRDLMEKAYERLYGESFPDKKKAQFDPKIFSNNDVWGAFSKEHGLDKFG